MALYPFVHVPALELHALSRYPGNRENDRQKHQQTTVCLHSVCAPRHSNEQQSIYHSKRDFKFTTQQKAIIQQQSEAGTGKLQQTTLPVSGRGYLNKLICENDFNKFLWKVILQTFGPSKIW